MTGGGFRKVDIYTVFNINSKRLGLDILEFVDILAYILRIKLTFFKVYIFVVPFRGFLFFVRTRCSFTSVWRP
jgi:hypothetical protein